LRIEDFIERSLPNAALAEAHQNRVAGHAVQPSGERGLSTEVANTAEDGKESLLRKIFRRCGIFHHSQAKGVHTRTMAAIKGLERRGIP